VVILNHQARHQTIRLRQCNCLDKTVHLTHTNFSCRWTFKSIVATIALSGLYVGSQIPLYFVGGSLSFIAESVGGTEASAWLSVSYALAFAAVTPFCGYLQDLLGRRNITLVGGLALMMGIIILATAHHFRNAIVGMAFSGAGAAIGELTALAG
jgi:MFS family permease